MRFVFMFMVQQVNFFPADQFFTSFYQTFYQFFTDWRNWKLLLGSLNIIQGFAEQLAKMFICFFSHLLLTALFYSCVIHSYPFWSKHLAKNTASPELRGGQALSGYRIFPLQSFVSLPTARIKPPVMMGLCQAIFLPASSPRASSCSLSLFGLCWALLFLPAARLLRLSFKRKKLKNSSQKSIVPLALGRDLCHS